MYSITYNTYTPITAYSSDANYQTVYSASLETRPPYESDFKSTSSYKQMSSYQTVRPLNIDGTVSMDYTTTGNKQRYKSRGLDVDDDDEPVGGMVPIGDIPYVFIILLSVLTIFIKQKIIKINILNFI